MKKHEIEHLKKERTSTSVRKREFLSALKESHGIIKPAMAAAGIESRSTICNWRKKYPDFAAAMDAVEADCGDYVESKLLERIERGDTTAIIFYCKTKLKSRGYVERAELTGKDGKAMIPEPVTVEIIDRREDVAPRQQ